MRAWLPNHPPTMHHICRIVAAIPKVKIIFSTSTPVPIGDGGGSRTEANVRLYNAAAVKALAAGVASGRVALNDLHGDIVAKCGAGDTQTGNCSLQVPNVSRI